MRWAWEACDLNGVTRAVLAPRGVTITRAINKRSTVVVSLDSSADTAELSTTARIIRGSRTPDGGGARVIRAAGRSQGIYASAGADDIETVQVTAIDGFGSLESRTIQDSVSFINDPPWLIVSTIVGTQNVRANTGLTVPSVTSSGPPRDRTYEVGKFVSDVVQQLAEVDDGYWYRVDPVDEGATFSHLVLLHPSSGSQSVASFEFGDGTTGTLSGVEVDVMPPINSVTAFGAGDGLEQLKVTLEDAASIAEFGLFDATLTHNDVTELETLQAHAQDALRPTERKTFRVSVGLPDDDGLAPPSPWDDFDVGDTVGLITRGESPVLSYDGRALVTSFTVTIDENGVERISALDFQSED